MAIFVADPRGARALGRRFGFGRLGIALLTVGLTVAASVSIAGVSAAAAPSALSASATAADRDGGGGRIAFVRDDVIYTMNPDGSEQLPLLDPADGLYESYYAPAWSWDGTKLAYTALGIDAHLYVSDPDASDQIRVEIGWNPAWSPDGEKIAYMRTDHHDMWQTHVMFADGTGSRQLTTVEGEHPTWSPDTDERRAWSGTNFGMKLAFVQDGDLHKINEDGAGQTQLTDHIGYVYGPAWSPDGTKIAFSADKSGHPAVPMWVINANGTAPVRLAKDGRDPAWSPDGTKIAFTKEADGRREIHVMNADGTGQKRLTHAGGDLPAWQGSAKELWLNPCDEAMDNQYYDYYFDYELVGAHQMNVACVTILGVAGGTRDAQGQPIYRPREPTTRGQMASFVARVLYRAGVELPDPDGDQFTDIATTTHRRNINRLAHAGIVTGTGGGSFNPSAPITRQQMATFVVRAAEHASSRDLTAHGDWFADVHRANVHFGSVNIGLEQLLFEGTTRPVDLPRSGTFSPQRQVPREQMATFLLHLVEWLQRNDICSDPPGWCNPAWLRPIRP